MSHEHKSWCDVPPGLAELVNALQTLTVIRALKLLSHLIDRDNIEKEKQEDTDAVIQVAQQVCDMLKEVTITGPARTLPASWRDEHLNICLQIFKSNVSIHDDLSVRYWNKNAFRDAEKANSTSKLLMDEASNFKWKIEQSARCSICKDDTCGPGSDGGQWANIIMKYGELYADLRKRIFSHEEIIRKRLENDPAYQKKTAMKEKLERRKKMQEKRGRASDAVLPPSEEQLAKQKEAAERAMAELLEEEHREAEKKATEKKKKEKEEAERQKRGGQTRKSHREEENRKKAAEEAERQKQLEREEEMLRTKTEEEERRQEEEERKQKEQAARLRDEEEAARRAQEELLVSLLPALSPALVSSRTPQEHHKRPTRASQEHDIVSSSGAGAARRAELDAAGTAQGVAAEAWLQGRIFAYQTLHKATRGFAKRLGSGGFGSVFEGTLACGTQVA
jgi:hypothetical protein